MGLWLRDWTQGYWACVGWMSGEYIAGATDEFDDDDVAVRATGLARIRSWCKPAACARALKIPIAQTLWRKRQSAWRN